MHNKDLFKLLIIQINNADRTVRFDSLKIIKTMVKIYNVELTNILFDNLIQNNIYRRA